MSVKGPQVLVNEYTPDLILKFLAIHAAESSGDSVKTNKLMDELNEQEDSLFEPFLDDTKFYDVEDFKGLTRIAQLAIGIKKNEIEIDVLEKQKEAITHQFATQNAGAAKSFRTGGEQSSLNNHKAAARKGCTIF